MKNIIFPLWVMTTLMSPVANAQRGLTTHEPAIDSSPSRNVQSFFDTQMVQSGRFSFDFPSFQTDYGVNERWNVGVNALTLIPLLNFTTPLTLGLKVRHSLYSNEQWRAVISGQYFQIPFENNPDPVLNDASGVSRITLANLNISRLQNQNEFGLSTIYAHLNSTQNPGSASDTSQNRTHGLASALWWRWHSNNRFGTELLGFIAPAIFESENNPLFETQSRTLGFAGFSFVRGLINWRTSDKWLWFAGAILFPGANSFALPYLGFALTFPEAETPAPLEESL